ncbi:melanoma-associated antigen B4-like [Acomys russatus]|uniref:melanoma-associated antigen B4-like n=1 Tax=Acomys russatus TaxID=60746 RepID=UPI0021E2C909|nr:melanoma-associated antigen B4-like [Acomys russatus]
MALLSRKAAMLVSFLLCRYKIKEPARRADMLKVINKRFKEHFPEIFEIARCRLDIVFGIEMEEVQPNGEAYMLVSKLDFKDDGSSSTELGVPNRGILTPLLSVIFLNGYIATEKEVWHFLNMLGVYDEVPHLIFGNVRKLITEDIVEEKYLEYCQIPDSDLPCYQFLWGPRAYAETSQATVKDFLAKIRKAMPSAAWSPYEQALIEEAEKMQAKSAYKPETKGKAKGHSKSK